MSRIQPPPLYDPIVNDGGKVNISWALYFNQLFEGDTGTTWTPTFTNLTTVGTPTITGSYYKLGRLVYFSILITPSTSTSATAGSTYCTFPLDVKADGACFAVSGLLAGGYGMVEASTNRIYVPAWSAVTVPLTVTGLILAQ